jgi:hypothetical protein
MEIDSFPVAPTDAPLEYTLAILKEAQRSAVVTADAVSYSLVTAAEIVIARAEESATTLSGIRDRAPLTAFPYSMLFAQIGRFLQLLRRGYKGGRIEGVLDFRDPDLARRVEQYLDERKIRYAIFALTSSRALLVSRFESDMRSLQASPSDCYCKADLKPVSPGVHRGDCPYDYSHKGTVRCY